MNTVYLQKNVYFINKLTVVIYIIHSKPKDSLEMNSNIIYHFLLSVFLQQKNINYLKRFNFTLNEQIFDLNS